MVCSPVISHTSTLICSGPNSGCPGNFSSSSIGTWICATPPCSRWCTKLYTSGVRRSVQADQRICAGQIAFPEAFSPRNWISTNGLRRHAHPVDRMNGWFFAFFLSKMEFAGISLRPGLLLQEVVQPHADLPGVALFHDGSSSPGEQVALQVRLELLDRRPGGVAQQPRPLAADAEDVLHHQVVVPQVRLHHAQPQHG